MVFKYYATFIVFAIQNLCLPQIATSYDVPSKYPPNFESNVSFTSFPSTNAKYQSEVPTATETPGSLGKPIFIFPLGNDFPQPTVTSGISNVSSFTSYQTSTIPSSLEIFISTFTNAVHTSPIISNAFDLSATSIQSIENIIYDGAYALYKSLGISDPTEIATYSSRPVTENFEILTYPMLVKIDSNAMGKQLLAEGILNDNNAVSLALEFADAIESSAIKTVQENYTKSKFQALVDGYVGFLKSKGIYTAEKILETGRYFVEEVKRAGERFGTSPGNHAPSDS